MIPSYSIRRKMSPSRQMNAVTWTAILGLAAALGIATGLWFTGSGSGEAGPTTAGRPATLVTGSALPPIEAGEARALLQAYAQAGRDPRAMKRLTVLGECGGPGYGSLESAVANAQVIVVGTVVSMEFAYRWPDIQQQVRLRVDEPLKGTTASELAVTITGGPWLLPRDGEMVLTQHQTNPLLLPGDRGVFLMHREELTGNLVPQGYSGQHLFRDGVISPVPGSPAGPEVAGITQVEFIRRVKSLAAR